MVKNLVNYLTYIPKRAVALVAIAVLVLAPLAAFASWSPDRPVKDWNNPADRTGFDHVVFNSFINTPNYGDERTFFDAKDATNTAQGGFQNLIDVNDGQELLLRTYVHNNGNQDLNATGQTVAHNSKVQVVLPSATDKNLRAVSYISASNATPQAVSDTVDFVNDTPFNMEYVPGSATAYTNAVPGGYQVADSIVSGGAPIGYTGPNGEIPGCFEFDAIVTIKVKVKMGNFSVNKQVRKEGEKEWKENVTVNPGDTVEYNVTFTNTSGIELKNVVVGDVLPSNQTYIAGSTMLANATFPNGTEANDGITTGGLDIGNYSPGANAFVKFKAKVAGAEQLQCGTHNMVNKAVVQPKDEQSKEDTASVTTSKPCAPGEVPVTPSELPNTGIEGPLAGLLGSGGLGVAVRSYIRSRRGLASALLDA